MDTLPVLLIKAIIIFIFFKIKSYKGVIIDLLAKVLNFNFLKCSLRNQI